MDDFGKKAFVMAIAVVCLTIAIISSFSIGNVVNPIKTILKNIKNENSFDNSNINYSDSDLDCETAINVERGASGAICIEQSTRRILYEEHKNTKCYPASTTKVLTALIAIERLPLDKIVTVKKEGVGIEGSSIYLKEGDKISVEDLLYGLMLRSGNDAAVTLALEICDDISEFADIMNEKAANIGAINSHFVNPHGLHDDNHYTTVYDMALICAKAYENDEFVRIVSTKQRKITVNDEARYIANKNKLLRLFDGANGAKTGFTKKSGRCLVGGARRGDMQLITVVFNHGDMWNDTVRMLNFGFDNYEMVAMDNALLTKGKNVVKIKIDQNVTPNWRDIKYPLKKDGSERLVVEQI